MTTRPPRHSKLRDAFDEIGRDTFGDEWLGLMQIEAVDFEGAHHTIGMHVEARALERRNISDVDLDWGAARKRGERILQALKEDVHQSIRIVWVETREGEVLDVPPARFVCTSVRTNPIKAYRSDGSEIHVAGHGNKWFSVVDNSGNFLGTEEGLGQIRVSEPVNTFDDRRSKIKGGSRSKFNSALQEFVNDIVRKMVEKGIKPTTKSFQNEIPKGHRNSLETGLNCDLVYRDGEVLCWSEEQGDAKKVQIDSIRPYINRAKNRMTQGR